MKQFNSATGCFIIEIFVNKVYLCSTAQSKSCKEAVKKIKQKYVFADDDKITAHYKQI